MKQISSTIINSLINYKIITEEEIPIYEYGVKILFYKAGYIISLICICIILNRKFINLLIFYFSFMLLRRYSGGYHSKNYISCITLFLIIYFFLDLGVAILHTINSYLLIIIFLVISLLIYIKSPIDCANKRLSQQQKLENKNKTLLVLLILFSTYMICDFLGFKDLSLTILYSLFIILLLLHE